MDGLEKMKLVGSELIKPKRARKAELLRKNIFKFAWSPMDMPGLDLSMVVYKLNINPNTKRVV